MFIISFPYTNSVRHDNLSRTYSTSSRRTLSGPLIPSYEDFFAYHHSWSSGNAITTPKMEKSNSIIHVGNGFLFFLTSFNPSTLLMSSPLDSNFFSKTGLELLSGDVSDETLSGAACSESCCWLYFSTYSGKIFLNVALHGKLSIQQELVVKHKLERPCSLPFWMAGTIYLLLTVERKGRFC